MPVCLSCGKTDTGPNGFEFVRYTEGSAPLGRAGSVTCTCGQSGKLCDECLKHTEAPRDPRLKSTGSIEKQADSDLVDLVHEIYRDDMNSGVIKELPDILNEVASWFSSMYGAEPDQQALTRIIKEHYHDDCGISREAWLKQSDAAACSECGGPGAKNRGGGLYVCDRCAEEVDAEWKRDNDWAKKLKTQGSADCSGCGLPMQMFKPELPNEALCGNRRCRNFGNNAASENRHNTFSTPPADIIRQNEVSMGWLKKADKKCYHCADSGTVPCCEDEDCRACFGENNKPCPECRGKK